MEPTTLLRKRKDDDHSPRVMRARVHGGALTLLEKLDLPEGLEVILQIEMPHTEVPKQTQRVDDTLPAYPLGTHQPLTRREIYEDVG